MMRLYFTLGSTDIEACMGTNETIGQIGRQTPSAMRSIPPLTGLCSGGQVPWFLFLPGGVMVAPVTLTHLVLVRIQAGQPSGIDGN